MLWNPFQYQYNSTYIADEGEMALVEIRKGAGLEQIRLPKSMLPSALPIGGSFTLKIEDSETARTGEIQTLRKLLGELIQ